MKATYNHLQLCSKLLREHTPVIMVAKSVDVNHGKSHVERAQMLSDEIKSTYKPKIK